MRQVARHARQLLGDEVHRRRALADRSQKRASWRLLTGMAFCTRKRDSSCAVSRSPRRVAAWPTVEQGGPTGL